MPEIEFFQVRAMSLDQIHNFLVNEPFRVTSRFSTDRKSDALETILLREFQKEVQQFRKEMRRFLHPRIFVIPIPDTHDAHFLENSRVQNRAEIFSQVVKS